MIKMLNYLSLADKEMLLNATSTQARGANNPNLLLISKINFLNTYFNFIQNSSQDKKNTTKNSKSKATQLSQISDEFVHKIVIATSTKAIQEIQNEFVRTDIMHLKKNSTSSRKIKMTNLHPAIHAEKPVKKVIRTETIATTTEEITPVATTTESVKEVIGTTTETQ
jgi:chlorite dismutase